MSWQWYELQFPSELTSDAVLHFTRTLAIRRRRGLLMSADPVMIEVQGAGGRITWRLGVSGRDHQQVLTALRQALPDVQTDVATYPEELPSGAWELRLSSSRRALRTDVPEQISGALLSAVLRAGRDERVLLQWLIGPWLHRPVVPAVSTRRDSNSILDLYQLQLDSEQTRALRDKQAEPVFGVVGRVAVQAASAHRQGILRQGIIGALQVLRSPGVGFERRLLPIAFVRWRLRRFQRPTIAWPIMLNAQELTACLGWPIGNPVLPGVAYGGHRHLPPSQGSLVSGSGTDGYSRGRRITGRSTFPAQPGLLNLPARDALHHLHVIGPTGTGKSTLLANLAMQDIAAGRGVVVIDPKRDLVDVIVDRIPAERLHDVVLLDPTDDHPVGFNVLRARQPELAVDTVLHVFQELYAANWGPRTADILHNGLLSLTAHGGYSLCELPPLLLNAQFRRQVTGRLRDDHLGVGPFWHWFERLSAAEQATVTGPVLNKLRAFTSRPAIRGVIGQANGFDLGEVFTKRTVLLVSLAKGDIGSESAHLLGALLLGSLWATIQRRSQIAPERRHPVFVYLDEFGDILRLPLDLGDALTQARGLGVGWVLAHQHLGQLTPSVRAATLANARSRIVFQSGHDDATALAKVLGGGLTTNDLQGLRAYETYQALSHGNRTLSPASAATLPLPPAEGTAETVWVTSRSRYGVARADTDAELLARRQGGHSTEAPIGSRSRNGATS